MSQPMHMVLPPPNLLLLQLTQGVLPRPPHNLPVCLNTGRLEDEAVDVLHVGVKA